MRGDIVYVDYERSSWRYMDYERKAAPNNDLDCYKIGGAKQDMPISENISLCRGCVF